MTANTILQAREAPADEKLRQGGAGSALAEAVLPLLEAAEAMLGNSDNGRGLSFWSLGHVGLFFAQNGAKCKNATSWPQILPFRFKVEKSPRGGLTFLQSAKTPRAGLRFGRSVSLIRVRCSQHCVRHRSLTFEALGLGFWGSRFRGYIHGLGLGV